MLLPSLACQKAHPYEAVGTPQAQVGAGKRRRGSFRAAATLFGALLCSGGLWAAVWNDMPTVHGLGGTAAEPPPLQGLRTRTAKPERTIDADPDAQMQVLVTNSYRRDGDSWERLYPWEHVAEPMRETRLEITSWPGSDSAANKRLAYTCAASLD